MQASNDSTRGKDNLFNIEIFFSMEVKELDTDD